ncbi:MAG: carbohydrate kinase family protein [Verrucomicrobia bacterium]|nr:carbohydrate kinase family protein [Verrucomicrobiota bacterium]
MNQALDCVCCGSCVADILVRPVPLAAAIGAGMMLKTDPLRLTTGGIACNSSIAMTRLGLKTAVLAYVGNDEWGEMIHRRMEREGIYSPRLLRHPSVDTSTSVVLIDPAGERTFAHYAGASCLLDKAVMLANLDLFARSRMMLLGYYSQLPALEEDLPEVLAAIRATGCRTALDAGGSGGFMQPLDRILPHLDVYVPSRIEAVHQTGQTDPRAIIDTFRGCGAPGIVGVKLDSEGALLSPAAGVYVEVPCVPPPGQIIDTTGAGDAFFAGLLTGLLRGLGVADAGCLGAATASCSITGLGAVEGIHPDRVIRVGGPHAPVQGEALMTTPRERVPAAGTPGPVIQPSTLVTK